MLDAAEERINKLEEIAWENTQTTFSNTIIAVSSVQLSMHTPIHIVN
jgi:hypothetical protein